jgi:uncharacterized integral membrane protein (TIGR00697 family)
LFFILSGIFIANAIIAELVGAKIFSVEKILGIHPLQLHLPTGVLDLNLSVGVIMWPLVFIFSDIINEYFGKEGVRKISFFTAILIAYSFIVLLLGTHLPPADFWLKNNGITPTGQSFDINYAYAAIFRQGMGIIIGSITAFLLSQMIDAYTFEYMKKITGHKKLWLRATGSTVVSQLFDSFVILFVAFYVFGNWNMEQVVSVGVVQYFYKIILAILLTPLLYGIHYIIDKYLK